jgi:hypothetical protein
MQLFPLEITQGGIKIPKEAIIGSSQAAGKFVSLLIHFLTRAVCTPLRGPRRKAGLCREEKVCAEPDKAIANGHPQALLCDGVLQAHGAGQAEEARGIQVSEQSALMSLL